MKAQTGKSWGCAPSKLKKLLNMARFLSDVLVPGPSRDVSEKVVVGPTTRRGFRLEAGD